MARRALLAGVLLALLVAALPSAARAAPPRLEGCVRAGSDTSLVTLRSSDGARLRGAVAGHGSTGVVLLHQSDGTVCLDAVAAVTELRRRGAARVFLVGASLGGTAALVAASETPVEGVVDLSGPAQYGPLDAGAAIGRVSVPLLLAAGAADTDFVGDNRALAAAAAAADTQLRVYPGPEHGVDLLRVGPEPHGSLLVENFLAWHVRHPA